MRGKGRVISAAVLRVKDHGDIQDLGFQLLGGLDVGQLQQGSVTDQLFNGSINIAHWETSGNSGKDFKCEIYPA
jgi:hypothetical protein